LSNPRNHLLWFSKKVEVTWSLHSTDVFLSYFLPIR
jgi:hypothetical protein